MTDEAEADGSIAESFADILLDERTRAHFFAAVGPDGGVVADGAAKDPRSAGVKICATAMLHYAKISGGGEEEFVRDVISEMNERRGSAFHEVME